MKSLRGQKSLFPMMMHAEFSEDLVYRYSLTRCWNSAISQVNFITLNPSTADETNNDLTIRRCISYADKWGYGGLVVTNLFAVRSPDPRFLRKIQDPVGPENDSYLLKYANQCDKVVCAWGNHGVYQRRDRTVIRLLKGYALLTCLSLTSSGQPAHLLRLRGDLMPQSWL